MRIALIIEYDGSDFCGWQSQTNGNTIQQAIEKAHFDAFKEKITLTASGRTDSGVHAIGQVAHFDTSLKVPAEKFKYALNTFLPSSIKIKSSFEVEGSFHARYSAKRKTYVYALYESEFERPLLNRYAVCVKDKLDVEKMSQSAQLLVGKHDFCAFSSTGSSVKQTTREIYFASVERQGEKILITVTGEGFLYNMVRIIAGTLVDIGRGAKSEDVIEKAFLTKDRTLLGKTMSPNGLTLACVEYEKGKIV